MPTPPPRLPVPLTSFIGRSADLDRLRHILAAGARLITLFGPGGIGKTRLALRFAETCWTGGAWFFDLSDARSLGEVCAIIRHKLGIEPPVARQRTVEEAGAVLAMAGPGLFLFDNCEQVAPELADAIVHWCEFAESARFIATSRELLRVPGEHAYEVLPLALPEEGAPPAGSEAVQLFVDRAQLARHDFAPSDAEARTVAAIVRRLDGLPLAIELAAARMGVLGTAELLERLAGRLDISAVRRGTPPRQMRLRVTIDWSWKLLTPWEQAALAQCSVFCGGFSLRAAEAVLDLSSFPDAPTVLDVVQSLREKSFVRTTARPGAAHQDERLGLYDTMREYAREKLAAQGDEAATLARHAAFYVGVGVRWLAHGSRTNAPDELAALGAELDNLLAVEERALAVNPPHAHNALVCALSAEAALSLRGNAPLARGLIDGVLSAVGDSESDPALVSLALSTRSRLEHGPGDEARRRTDLERAVALARLAGDRIAEGRAIAGLGHLAAETWNRTVAEAQLGRALDLHRATCDVAAEVRALRALGVSACDVGRRDEARALLEEAREAARKAGDLEQVALCLCELAVIEISLGRLEAGIAQIDEARDLFLSLGEPPFYLAESAFALQELGRFDEAEARYGEAIAIDKRCGRAGSFALSNGLLATLFHERGDLDKARGAYELALASSKGSIPPGPLGFIHACSGALLARLGRIPDASRELDAADALLSGLGGDWAQIVAVLRGHVDLAFAAERAALGDLSEAERARTRAAERLTYDSAKGDRLRFALRLLELEIDRQCRAPAEATEETLVVGPEARWFRFGKAPAVDLGKRRPIRLVLGALAQARLARPGEPLSAEALVREGWKDERVSTRAGMNRLRVALSELRTKGLRNAITSRWDGYLVPPNVQVVMSGEPVAPE